MTEPRGSIAGDGPIVHVTADFPDSIDPAKSRVIETLVRLVEDRFDQRVISLNRRFAPGAFARAWLAHPLKPRLEVREGAANGATTPLVYHAPGQGLYHATMLRQLGEWLAERLAAGPRPALLVGHKLAVEGIVVRHAAELLGVPYALSIQGNTDLRIATMRPDLRPLLAQCFHGAAVAMPFTPWALAGLERLLGKRSGPMLLVPCPMHADAMMPPRPGGDGLVTAFHLRHRQIKNLDTLAAAGDRLARKVPEARLAVVGGGGEDDLAACARLARRHPALSFEGPLPLAEMPARLNRASGFALASRRESFGLVFVESLFAGTPIVYPAGRAVDGYFDHAPFALRVRHDSADEITDAMARLLREEHTLKAALAEWQQTPAAARFRRNAIADVFGEGLTGALGAASQSRS